MRKLSVAGVLLCAASIVRAQPVIVFDIDPAASSVNFTLKDVLHTVRGTFRIKSGNLQFDRSTGTVGGAVTVDAASGNTGSGARDSRMKKNILEVDRYPEIAFSPDRVQGTVAPEGSSNVQVHGLFRIHGAEHELTVPAEVQMSRDHMTATLRFDVPYVQWGMKNPSTLFLRVDDKVAIEIRAVARVTQSAGAAAPHSARVTP